MSQSNNHTGPPKPGDVTVMIVWPTIAATGAGRWVGRLSGIPWGLGGFFTLGKLLAVATIPVSLAVFAWQLLPYVCRRYKLTTRRMVIQKGLSPVDEKSIGLDEFDAIDVEVLPGQEWLRAGELIFRRDGAEVFRLPGVSRAEVFRQVCLKTPKAVLSVRQVLRQQQTASEEPAAL